MLRATGVCRKRAPKARISKLHGTTASAHAARSQGSRRSLVPRKALPGGILRRETKRCGLNLENRYELRAKDPHAPLTISTAALGRKLSRRYFRRTPRLVCFILCLPVHTGRMGNRAAQLPILRMLEANGYHWTPDFFEGFHIVGKILSNQPDLHIYMFGSGIAPTG